MSHPTDEDRPAEYRAIWDRKPGLRAIYTDYYQRIVAACQPGPTLEIGGGSGNMKAFLDAVVSTDIMLSPWLDAACDAHRLPFASGYFANIVMVDVLHHLERPGAFFSEARRVLRPGGRIVMVEPAITPMSAPFYNWLHPEPVDMHQDLMALPKSPPEAGRDPFDANQAIPTLIFSDPTGPVMRSVAEGFTVYDKHLISFWAYPLSGGFRHWGLVNGGMARIALRIERLFEPVIGRIAAFRLFVVLERS